MNIREFTKPLTAKKLNESLAARFGAKKSEKKMKTTFIIIVKIFHVTVHVEVGFLVHLDQNGPNM